jgi:hypothetical protein
VGSGPAAAPLKFPALFQNTAAAGKGKDLRRTAGVDALKIICSPARTVDICATAGSIVPPVRKRDRRTGELIEQQMQTIDSFRK